LAVVKTFDTFPQEGGIRETEKPAIRPGEIGQERLNGEAGASPFA
jgi:hypothetical protein